MVTCDGAAGAVEKNSFDSELERYVSHPQLKTDTNVNDWWLIQKGQYPNLYRLALDFLAIPASSVPSERENSLARVTFESRERLTDASFRCEMCLRSWWKLFHQLGYQIPDSVNEELTKLNVDWGT